MGQKLVSVLVSLILVLSFANVGGRILADEHELISFDDVRIVISQFVANQIDSTPDCTWTMDMRCKSLPLYDNDDNLAAYHVTFTSPEGEGLGYATVLAFAQNPVVVEFSFESRTEELATERKNYYAGAGLYLVQDESDDVTLQDSRSLEDGSDGISKRDDNLASFWASLKMDNQAAVDALSEGRSAVQSGQVSADDADSEHESREYEAEAEWGMFPFPPGGSGVLTSKGFLTAAIYMDFYKTGDFGGENHCGAIAAMNVIRYYKSRLGFENPFSNSTYWFNYMYANTGNGGPTLPSVLLNALEKYTRLLGSPYKISTSTSGSQDDFIADMENAINSEKMPLLVIWKGAEAHWVNVIGYLHYNTQSVFVRVASNWTSAPKFYFMVQAGGQIMGNVGGFSFAKIYK